ncbi:MAG: 2-phospho-L-lactate guanylyltransferase [Methanosarcinaceae archaeon]|nr:2-phospho-L-lactate guanylyltransferase [Methanosarcinaceae archaeon]
MDSFFALIPYRPQNPKSRLSGVLSVDQRLKLSRLMFENTIETLVDSGLNNIDVILKPTDVDILYYGSIPDSLDDSFFSPEFLTRLNVFRNNGLNLRFLFDESSLNDAINSYLESSLDNVLIVMADLPLVRPFVLKRLMLEKENIVIAPGRGGGTNILKISNAPDFRVKYYGKSFENHVREAEKHGYSHSVFDSFYAGTDIDEPSDLAEILIHAEGAIYDFVAENFVYESEVKNMRPEIKKKLKSDNE